MRPKWIIFWWVSNAPLGFPVLPEVYTIIRPSSVETCFSLSSRRVRNSGYSVLIICLNSAAFSILGVSSNITTCFTEGDFLIILVFFPDNQTHTFCLC